MALLAPSPFFHKSCASSPRLGLCALPSSIPRLHDSAAAAAGLATGLAAAGGSRKQQQQQLVVPTRAAASSSSSESFSEEWSSSVTVQTCDGGGVTEVDRDSFWRLADEACDEGKVVVLDMYTQWCGPCKLMLPKIVALSATYTDVVFFKLDCNQHNKALAKELGIRVVPTFKILKHKRRVMAEVIGAKFDELVKSIEAARMSP